MAQEDFRKFEELLRGSDELQAELKAAAEAYDGDTGDAKAIFDATLGKVAGGVGLAFTYEDALASLASARELSEAELDNLAGGGFCFIIGGQGGSDCECEVGHGGYACSYVGFTTDI